MKLLSGTNPSYQRARRFARSYGQLHDLFAFKRRYKPLEEDEADEFIDEYAATRLSGTIDPEIGDVTGLLWEPTSQNTVANELVELAHFSDYAARKLNQVPLVRWDREFSTTLRGRLRDFHVKKNSVLAHLKNRSSTASRDPVPSPSIKRQRSKSQYRSFPPDRIGDLYDAYNNDRDRLQCLLMAYGSLRISEGLHIFPTDVRPPDDLGLPTVFVAHPSEGMVQWVDHDRRTRATTRRTYLLERYERLPRNLIDATSENGDERAGFKGMMFDDQKHKVATVYFSEPSAAREFWRLHQSYMKDHRAPVGDLHPYYFINIDKRSEGYGRPLTMAAAESAFYAAAERIGLKKGELGVSPHGLRHYYGFYIRNVLGLPLDVCQICMHHEAMSSTLGYTKSSPLMVRRRLVRPEESEFSEFEASRYFDVFRDRSLTFLR